jgi:hypothetical protein
VLGLLKRVMRLAGRDDVIDIQAEDANPGSPLESEYNSCDPTPASESLQAIPRNRVSGIDEEDSDEP